MSREIVLALLLAVCLASVVIGVALVSVSAAFVVGGLLGVPLAVLLVREG